jgi:hypothetical protein
MSRPRRALVLGVAGLAILAIVAVLVGALDRPADRTETGVVIGVDSVSLTDVRGFTLRTTDGRTVVFRIGELQNAGQFPPGHLGEHQATATPIVVTYREVSGERLAVRLEDAPATATTSPG